ncbi:hypothetical protein D3C77_557720 [compost metagenome]
MPESIQSSVIAALLIRHSSAESPAVILRGKLSLPLEHAVKMSQIRKSDLLGDGRNNIVGIHKPPLRLFNPNRRQSFYEGSASTLLEQ